MFAPSAADLFSRVLLVILLLLSLTVHEWAHAWSAHKLGDDTASLAGRLTLNPLAHVDVIGTILLPLLGIPFGWARPVPVNPARFRRSVSVARGMTITAAAGPLSNVLLAILCTVALGLLARYAPETVRGDAPAAALLAGGPFGGVYLPGLIQINVTLALFNLLPVPPLDGGRIVDGLVPLRLRPAWEGFARLAPFLLLAVVFLGGRLIAGPSSYVLGLLQSLMNSIVA